MYEQSVETNTVLKTTKARKSGRNKKANHVTSGKAAARRTAPRGEAIVKVLLDVKLELAVKVIDKLPPEAVSRRIVGMVELLPEGARLEPILKVVKKLRQRYYCPRSAI